MVPRTVIAELWCGAVVVHRLGTVAAISDMSDSQVTKQLRRLDVAPMPATPELRVERLEAWPLQADLDAIATAHTAWNDGVRPVVRVLEASTLPGRSFGVAGSVPR